MYRLRKRIVKLSPIHQQHISRWFDTTPIQCDAMLFCAFADLSMQKRPQHSLRGPPVIWLIGHFTGALPYAPPVHISVMHPYLSAMLFLSHLNLYTLVHIMQILNLTIQLIRCSHLVHSTHYTMYAADPATCVFHEHYCTDCIRPVQVAQCSGHQLGITMHIPIKYNKI